MFKRAGFGGLKIESIANAAAEIARIVGFLQDGESLVLGFLQQADVGAVAGSKNNRDIGFDTANGVVGFGAVHLGQDHIEKQQVDLVAMVFEFADRGFTIVGGDDRVAEPFESFAGEIAKAFRGLQR
jgi:hypothetical protein